MRTAIRCISTLFVAVWMAAYAYAGAIHDAVKDGRADDIRQMIAADTALISTTDESGNTPLHVACQTGSVALARLLIDSGAPLNPKNKANLTPLRLAIQRSNNDCVTLLLDRGAGTDDIHPMYGSVINQAFAVACQNNTGPVVVESLIEHGATFDASQADALGMTPLDWAVHFGSTPMARLALRHGGDVNRVSERLGRTPLVAAVTRGNEEIAAALLDAGADVTIPDRDGRPPVFHATDQGRTTILKALLSRGASIGFTEPVYGRSLLHLAGIKGYRDIAEDLVSRLADIDATDNAGKTPLFYALKYGNKSVADYLARHGAVAPDSPPTLGGVPPRVADSDASIWYLNHRGWVVATENHSLVFDAEQFGVRRSDDPALTNGFVTAGELKDESVVALYSCYHGMPGEPAYIHALADSIDEIAYVHLEDDAWRGSPNTTYLRAGADTLVAGISLQTIAIADYMPTLAYMCRVDGLNIYYQAFETDSLDSHRRRLESLSPVADTVDIAFLPIPETDQEDSDLEMFLRRFPTRAVVLLDASRREYLFFDVARRVADWGFPTKVLCAENPGDHFSYQLRR